MKLGQKYWTINHPTCEDDREFYSTRSCYPWQGIIVEIKFSRGYLENDELDRRARVYESDIFASREGALRIYIERMQEDVRSLNMLIEKANIELLQNNYVEDL